MGTVLGRVAGATSGCKVGRDVSLLRHQEGGVAALAQGAHLGFGGHDGRVKVGEIVEVSGGQRGPEAPCQEMDPSRARVRVNTGEGRRQGIETRVTEASRGRDGPSRGGGQPISRGEGHLSGVTCSGSGGGGISRCWPRNGRSVVVSRRHPGRSRRLQPGRHRLH